MSWLRCILVVVVVDCTLQQHLVDHHHANVFAPHTLTLFNTTADLLCQPHILQQLSIPHSLTHWLRFNDFQAFVQQVNNYQLVDNEESVLIRLVGGIGIGRFLNQMFVQRRGQEGKTRSYKQRKMLFKYDISQKKNAIVKRHLVEESVQRRIMKYNVSIGKRITSMFIEKDKYISKQVIDKGEHHLLLITS